jgi:16S rRNA C1402 (ribose-2'-O) methylase RsmI
VGFLPKKEGKRTEMFDHLIEMGKLQKFTAVIYESPQRTEKIMGELIKKMGGDAECCVAIDLTKVSEKVYRGTLASVYEVIKSKKTKGEIVIMALFQ